MDQSPITIHAAGSPHEPGYDSGRWIVRMTLAGFGLMFVASGLLWLRYGPDIFFDSLNALTGCF